MHRVIPALLLVLAGCGAPGTQGAFRDPEVPLYSNAMFEPARLAGDWRQVAEFARPGAPLCVPGVVRFKPRPDGGLDLAARLCLDGQALAFDGGVAITGAGRMVLRGADPKGIGGEWWVVWVDSGYRTLAIATPSGSFGFVFDRGDLPADRDAAAREILAWSGHDLARLRPVAVR